MTIESLPTYHAAKTACGAMNSNPIEFFIFYWEPEDTIQDNNDFRADLIAALNYYKYKYYDERAKAEESGSGERNVGHQCPQYATEQPREVSSSDTEEWSAMGCCTDFRGGGESDGAAKERNAATARECKCRGSETSE